MPKNFTYKTEKVDANDERTLEELEKEQKMLLEKIEALKKLQAEEKAKKEAEEKAAAEAREKAEAAERARKEAEEKAEIERKMTLLKESAKIEEKFPIHVDGLLDIENPCRSPLVARNFDSRYAITPYLVVMDVVIRPATSQEARKGLPDLTEDDLATLATLAAKF